MRASLSVGDGGGVGDVEVCRLARGSDVAGKGDGLARADPEVDGTGGDGAIALGVDHGEFAGCEGEGDGLGSAGVEMDALEAGEGAYGSVVDVGMRDVEFDDFVPRVVGGVGDVGGDGDGGVAGERR